ncbi:isoleucine--tRNA ligase [Acidicapsa acidisoli]|uniref:isoleucine--tRNA ligase n=1 Tax=Acidicapsa acidisoli TaxID=1615681 RepID=UPI0021E0C258|nr:isoleucine--tRNA ligase [Acidicapsa acidisoli]
MSAVPELKATLTLPKTDFPMKANLPQNEPERLKRWESLDIYTQLRKAAAGRPAYLLHDGPPYANGPLHLGHALNKGLKDFVVKSKTMAGFDSPYVPGYDCHGLPIEIKVDEQLGRKKLEMPAPAVLDACRAYAQKYVDLQTSQFERLGIFGRWRDPYKTMSRDYEARTLETFYGFFEKGFVYRGLKPVYWCINDRTALADAEIEYEQHTSPSVYVRYRLTSGLEALGEEAATALAGREVYTIIWTTTPWTLPASMAVAFHPSFEYVALSAGQEADAPVYIVASELAASVATACKLGEPSVLARFPGDRLDRATFQHPFLDRSILGVNADYVTADQGTGAVHTAPSHGADDFYTGVRYGLDATTRVDNAGVIHVDTSAWHEAELPAFHGKKVFAANPLIIDLLRERGALMGHEEIRHSYPHCWRCHKPVIFRATEQWFIGLETPVLRADGSDTTFRQLTIEEIGKVNWDPAWGQERITNMIATRPDWCISRQRIWGVPIAVFLCTGCNTPVEDAALNARIVKLFEEHGAEAWHTTSVADLLPAGTVCKKCGSTEFRKETDILDVWFDSGSSWHAVAETDRDLRDMYNRPDSDGGRTVLYLEGGDQHRGWFHSSLLASVALRGRAPYTNVATAGWTLDELGRAMSKSLGNGVDPVEIAEKMGGEIVRLWVASIDFREDMAASENLMKRCAEIYRKLRNTFKFLLGNLHGFDPVAHQVATADLEPLDRYMLARTRELTEQVLRWYEGFEFHRIYHAVNEFAIADLSAFYLDVLKDRMYTFAPASQARRSAQTVLWKITEALARLLAPILSFTADEVWDYLPAVEGREVSVHLALFPAPKDIYPDDPTSLLAEWKQIFSVRDAALLVLEEARQEKRIGKGLEADLEIQAGGSLLELLRSHASGLKEILNVSAVRVVEGPELSVSALPASGTKCNRCWNFMPEVANYGLWESVCTRCHGALKMMGIESPADSTTDGEVSA